MRGRGAFNVSQPAMEAFPFSVLSKLVARYCRNLHPTGLLYGDPMGLLELREAIGRYLRAARAVRCDTAQIMITSGSQQALDIATRVLLKVGSPVGWRSRVIGFLDRYWWRRVAGWCQFPWITKG